MKRLMMVLGLVGLMSAGFAMPAMAKGHKNAAGGKHESKFDKIDADKDGKISFGEFKAWHEARAAARASKHTGKHTGKAGGKKHLTMQERFDKRDQNHDGSITKEEWKATATHHKHHHKNGGTITPPPATTPTTLATGTTVTT